MSNCTQTALAEFTQRYIACWQQHSQHLPQSTDLFGIDSPCIVRTDAEAVYWQAVKQHPNRRLSIAETLSKITIRPEIHQFYGSQLAGDMTARWRNHTLSLIQVWNDEDFQRLEQNLIAHLQMQKRLKRTPTLFIAATAHDTEIISVNNLSGEVVLEDLISATLTPLSEHLAQFLTELEVELPMQYPKNRHYK